MDRTERGVAIPHRINEHAYPDKVEDLVEGPPFDNHFLVDRPEVFRSTVDLGHDPELGEARLHVAQDLSEVEISLRGPLLDHLIDLGVALRVERRERQILELLFQVLHAEAMRQRCVDVEGLARRSFLFEVGKGGHSAEIVEPIGQLDDQNPQVGRDRHDHLAHRGGLLLFLGVVLDPVEFGHSVDDPGQVGTELGLELLQTDRRVFDRVVQERAGDGHVVEALAGDDGGDRHRVTDVGLARLAVLSLVGLRGEGESPFDEIGFGLGVMLQEHAE